MTRPLRMLASPARLGADGNPYVDQLNQALRDRGFDVAPVSRRALVGRHDLVHVHWPEALVRWERGGPMVTLDVVKVLGALWVARLRGARLAWTGHNLGPHEDAHPRLSAAYFRAFGAMTDLVLSLSDSGVEALQQEHPWLKRRRVAVVPHGHYRDVYGAPLPAAEARRTLGLPAAEPVFLLMGQIRAYKRVPELIRAFEASRSGGAQLLIAGSIADPALAAEVTTLAATGSGTVLRAGRVPAEEVATLHSAADVVVLPYATTSTLNSGAAILALSLGRPVVVPDSGTMHELAAMVGPGWVHPCQGGPEEALRTAARAVHADRAEVPDLSALEWSRVGDMTASAFRELLTAAPARGRSRRLRPLPRTS